MRQSHVLVGMASLYFVIEIAAFFKPPTEIHLTVTQPYPNPVSTVNVPPGNGPATVRVPPPPPGANK